MPSNRKKSPAAGMYILKPKQKGRIGFHIPEEMWPKIIAEYEAGWSLYHLAKRIGTTHRTLSKKFTERGIPIRSRGKIKGKKYNELIKRIKSVEHRLVVEQGAKRAELMDVSFFDEDLLIDQEL